MDPLECALQAHALPFRHPTAVPPTLLSNYGFQAVLASVWDSLNILSGSFPFPSPDLSDCLRLNPLYPLYAVEVMIKGSYLFQLQ